MIKKEQQRILKIFLVTSLFLHLSLAKDLINTSVIDASDVLPKSVFIFGDIHSRFSFNDYYDENSNKVALGSLFQDNLSFNDILEDEDPAFRDITEGALRAYGINDFSDLAGSHGASFSIKTKVDNFFLGYGLTKKLSIFGLLPRVNITTNFSNKFTSSSKLQNLLTKLKSDGNYSQAEKIEKITNNPILYKLEEYNYNPQYIGQKSNWGDLRIFSRYNAYKSNLLNTTLGLLVAFPTGSTDHLDDFMKLYIGDNQYDLGLEALQEVILTKQFKSLLSFQYINQLPFTSNYRIPINSNNPLSPDIDNFTRINFGDQIKTAFQSTYEFNKLFSFAAGYQFQMKSTDRYSGSKYESRRYNYLEENTNQRMHSYFMGFTINTIQAFLKKKFILPINLTTTYTHQFAGKNVPISHELQVSLLSFYK